MEGSSKFDFRFLGVYHDNDGHHMDANKDLVTGRAMSQWWDTSEDSGPAARSSERFSVETPTLECLAISDGDVKPLGLNEFIFFIRVHITMFFPIFSMMSDGLAAREHVHIIIISSYPQLHIRR